jgi:large subunit ribosomal protein L14
MVLQLGSKLKVADNSGANWVNCVSILGKGVKKRATAGSVILVSVIKFKHRTKVKKRMLYLGLVISVCS